MIDDPERAPPAPAAGQPDPAAPQKRRSRFRASFRRESFDADWDFVRRVLIVIVLAGLAYFLFSISRVLMLVFCATLIGVLLHALAVLLARYTPVPRSWALSVSVTLVAALVLGAVILFGAQVQGQVAEFLQQLPAATNAIGERFGVSNATEEVQKAISTTTDNNMMSRVAGFGYTAVGVLADLFLVMVAAVYFAADPALYRIGAIKMFPVSQHEKIQSAFEASARALRLWAAGQLVTMAIVGTLAGLAYMFIGLPSPLALGLLAGVTNFIPYLGPIFGAVPPLIFAMTMDTSTVVWTLGAVIAIQQMEGNVITPIIQRHAVAMPPALGLFAILVFGLMFGVLGVFLAIPLTVALMVLVKMLWIRETLGEETALPGEDEESDSTPATATSDPAS